MSGLGQALAMEKAGAAKDGDVKLGHLALYKHMDEWLIKGWENSVYEGRGDVLGAICNGCEADYIRAQTEAMDYLEWLKKFAVAFLDKKDSGKKQGSRRGVGMTMLPLPPSKAGSSAPGEKKGTRFWR